MNINNINNMINIENNIEKINNQSKALTIQDNVENKLSFGEYLKKSLENVNDLQIESDRQITLLATGQAENVHDITIAAAKSKVSLDLTMAVRNKVIEAYKEIMRMQV